MKFYKNLFSILTVLLLTGCQSVSLEDGNDADVFFENAQPVPFETIEQESYGSYDIEAQNLVIKDAAVFREFWVELHEGQQPLPPVTEVDFNRYMIVITVMGTRPSGGYLSEITEAGIEAGRLGIRIRKRSPGENCGVTAALTNPYHIVKMDRTDLKVKFFEEARSVDCTE